MTTPRDLRVMAMHARIRKDESANAVLLGLAAILERLDALLGKTEDEKPVTPYQHRAPDIMEEQRYQQYCMRRSDDERDWR